MKFFDNCVLVKMEILVENKLQRFKKDKKLVSKKKSIEVLEAELKLVRRAIETDQDLSQGEVFELLCINNEYVAHGESYLNCAECDGIEDNISSAGRQYCEVSVCENCQTVEGNVDEIFISYPKNDNTMIFVDQNNYRVYDSNDELLFELY